MIKNKDEIKIIKGIDLNSQSILKKNKKLKVNKANSNTKYFCKKKCYVMRNVICDTYSRILNTLLKK